MSVLLDIEMPKTARDCIFNQPAPFRGDFCIINNVCTFPDGCPLHEQKTGKWIPCSERLPEEEKTVLTWGKKHQCVLFDWMHDNKWCFGDEDYWMPLPEPPTIIEAEEEE